MVIRTTLAIIKPEGLSVPQAFDNIIIIKIIGRYKKVEILLETFLKFENFFIFLTSFKYR